MLVVEDDAKTAETVRLYLEHAGFSVDHAPDGPSGLAAARSGRFDLVILDLLLPRLEGTEVCRRLRRETRVPIIMLTAKAGEEDRIHGLDLGADDYVTKPFSPRELLARVRAVLRRHAEPAGEERVEIRRGELVLDLVRRRVAIAGRPIELTATEFRLLETLVRAAGRVFSRDELIESLHGYDFEGTDRTVDAHVKNLRRKIEPDRGQPRFIKTVVGMGYRFEAP